MNAKCPNCGGEIEVPDEAVGAKVRCPYCSHKWIFEVATNGTAAVGLSDAELIEKAHQAGDAEKYAEFIAIAEQCKNPDAYMCDLAGFTYQFGDGVEPNIQKANEWFAKGDALGCMWSQWALGCNYELGKGVAIDYAKAFALYKRAADQGFDRAQCNVGVLYLNGKGVQEDLEQAMFWFKKSAEQGFAMAQADIGEMYEQGLGVEKNLETALEWFEKAAAQNNDGAKEAIVRVKYELGVKFELDQDFPKAVEWYSQAAEAGNGNAQCNLGRLYMNGFGVEKDYATAMKWYTLSASADCGAAGVAQSNIGFLYENGCGVAKDLNKAKEYYLKAIDKGFEKAKEHLARVTKSIEEVAVSASQAKCSDYVLSEGTLWDEPDGTQVYDYCDALLSSDLSRSVATCDDCKKEFSIAFRSMMDLVTEPRLKQAITSGDAYRFKCPHCGKVQVVIFKTMAYDVNKKYFVRTVFDDKTLTALHQQKTMNMENLGLPPEKATGFRQRVVWKIPGLMEKILIFENGLDDYVIEMLKNIMMGWHKELSINDMFFDGIEGDNLKFRFELADGRSGHTGMEKEMYDKARVQIASVGRFKEDIFRFVNWRMMRGNYDDWFEAD